MTKTYESASVLVTWAPEGLAKVDLSSGWGEDVFLTVEPLGERVSTSFGADNHMSVSKMANKGATITLTLDQISPKNKELERIWGLQERKGQACFVGPFSVIDQVGDSAHFLTLNAVLTTLPGHSFGASKGEKSWTWVCESYFETDNLASITSIINEYIPFS